ncbi:MAG: hypothetical protein ACLFP1_08865 [Candidatus Goldiibacteriota bacterium]
MKKKLLMAMVLVLIFAASAAADVSVSKRSYAGAQGIGIGLEGGYWGGLSIKSWTGSDTAFQFNADFHFNGYFGGGVAHLWHFFEVIQVDGNKFPLYIGLKAGIWAHPDGFALSGLVPFGIAWIPRDIPIDIFIQYEPGIQILPGIGPDYMGGTAGIRLWFN